MSQSAGFTVKATRREMVEPSRCSDSVYMEKILLINCWSTIEFMVSVAEHPSGGRMHVCGSPSLSIFVGLT